MNLASDAVAVGLAVEFDPTMSPKGPCAANVRPLGPGQGSTIPLVAAPTSTDTEAPELGLPSSLRALVQQVTNAERHPALWLDKFVAPGNQERQRRALAEVVSIPGAPTLLEELNARRHQWLNACGSQRFEATTIGSLTLHLSHASVLENAGLCLHPVYGFTYLPGTGLKGLARAYAETVWCLDQVDPSLAWQEIEEVFGWAPGSDVVAPGKLKPWKPKHLRSHDTDEAAASGSVVFHDAWPTTWPHLVVDIANNHHRDYYQASQEDADHAPGDWEDPSIVSFLAVRSGTSFEFALSPRRADLAPAVLARARQWLAGALVRMGAGAKTSAGYGAFAAPAGDTISPGGPTSHTETLELVTPAYLAGGAQEREDCDLRPATLRGILRWWWRTMHAGFVDVATLRRMEAAVWGDANRGGAVRVTVRAEREVRVVPSPFKELRRRNGKERLELDEFFQREHRLIAPTKGATQGLFYHAYGMDETERGARQPRFCVLPGMIWSVTLSARPSVCRDRCLSADVVLEQAHCALRLLCAYGGVGSKARKGFGSFADISPAAFDETTGTAAAFRETCGLSETGLRKEWAHSPSLGHVIRLEIPTPWSDPWFVLDRVGAIAQEFAQALQHKEEKAALGLPRRIHGPLSNPLRHQDPVRWRKPEELTSQKGKRFASPALYHVARGGGGMLLIRLTAFPSKYLRSAKESEDMLTKLHDHVQARLNYPGRH